MPAFRDCIASDALTLVERVRAPSHGLGWGTLHEATASRTVLPGQGLVHWRGRDGQLFVDALTAFHLGPGEHYQLRHDAPRDHTVIVSNVVPNTVPNGERIAPAGARGWLVRPRDLFHLKRGCRGLQRGDISVSMVAQFARQALANALQIDATQGDDDLHRARRLIAAEAGRALAA